MSADYSAPSGKGLPFPTAALPTAPTASTPNQSARYTVETITSPGRETPAVQPQDGRLSMSMTMIMPTAVRIASQPAAPQQTTSAKPHRSRRPQHQARSTTARTTTARAASLDAPALVLQTGISSRKRQLHYSGLDVIVLGRRCHNNSRRKVHGRETARAIRGSPRASDTAITAQLTGLTQTVHTKAVCRPTTIAAPINDDDGQDQRRRSTAAAAAWQTPARLPVATCCDTPQHRNEEPSKAQSQREARARRVSKVRRQPSGTHFDDSKIPEAAPVELRRHGRPHNTETGRAS